MSVLYYEVFYFNLYVSLQLESQTPLYEASSSGHTDVVKLLLENKADPNISDNVSYSESVIPFH